MPKLLVRKCHLIYRLLGNSEPQEPALGEVQFACGIGVIPLEGEEVELPQMVAETIVLEGPVPVQFVVMRRRFRYSNPRSTPSAIGASNLTVVLYVQPRAQGWLRSRETGDPIVSP